MSKVMVKELDSYDLYGLDSCDLYEENIHMIKDLDSCDLYEEDIYMKPLMIRIEGISMIRSVISIEDELHIQDEGIQRSMQRSVYKDNEPLSNKLIYILSQLQNTYIFIYSSI